MTAREKWETVREMDSKISLQFGPNLVDRFIHDPKRIGFLASRYSFAAKMLADCDSILDIGCGDGAFSCTFLNETKATEICGMDFDKSLNRYAKEQLYPALLAARPQDAERIYFQHGDFFEQKDLEFDGISCLDMIEHLHPDRSKEFISRLSQVVSENGVVVIGTPNEYAAGLASTHSIIGHSNWYTPERLRGELKEKFSHVFMFGMNDSTLHVGHPNLWHYILAVCT